MKKWRKPLSLLLALLLVWSVAASTALSASAAKSKLAVVGEYEGTEAYDQGYSDGWSAGYNEYYGDPYEGSNPYDSDAEPEEYAAYEEGWSVGHSEGWDAAANEEPAEEHTREEGYAAGMEAADADFPLCYNATQCAYDSEQYPEYADGFQAGYDYQWNYREETEYSYEIGYADGLSDGESDYNNGYDKYTTTNYYTQFASYTEGWDAGYEKGYTDHYDVGYNDGFAAADYDSDNDLGEHYSSPDPAYSDYSDYLSGWSEGYTFEWNERHYYGPDHDYVLTTANGAIYVINPATLELTFVSGTFYGDFFTTELEGKAGVSSSQPIYSIKSVDPEAYSSELSGYPGVSFEGDCSGMFSNDHIQDNCRRIDLSEVDTSGVTNMSRMFAETGYTLDIMDLSGFDTSGVTNFSGMFYNCGADFIDISTFSLESAVRSENPYADGTFMMFAFADNLDAIIVPSNFEFNDYMGLYTPRGGWILLDGDGTPVSEDKELDLTLIGSSGTYNYSTIKAYDENSTEPIVYMEGLEQQAEFHNNYVIKHSLTLDGDIGVNFYIEMHPEVYVNGFEEFFSASFDWQGHHYEHQLSHGDFYKYGENNESVIYKVTVNVAAAEMASNIHVDFSAFGYQIGSYASDDYSVRQYAEVILNAAPGTFDNQDQLVTLVKEMLNYGAEAQLVFGVNTDDLANNIVSGYSMSEATADMMNEAISAANDGQTMSDMSANTEAFGLQYYGSSTVYLSETSIRHYYTITDQDAYNAAKDSANFSCDERKLPYVYFEYRNVPAAELDDLQTFTIGGQSYRYSVLDYARTLLTSSVASDDQKNLAQATYWYNDAANKYFSA